MVPAGLRGFAYGRGGVRYRLERGFPRRGCVLGRGARTHLTGSSFRAFRFATRSPGARRGRCPHRPVAPTPARDSQRQRKEKHLNAMTTPTISAPSATGRQSQTFRREKRARRQAKIGACTDPPPPVARRRERAGARLSGLFFWTVHGPFSFPQEGKENGGCIPLDQPPAGAEVPVAAGRRPVSP